MWRGLYRRPQQRALRRSMAIRTAAEGTRLNLVTAGRSPSPRALTFETHDGVEPLAAEWDALAARSSAAPFARPGWIAAWYAAFGRGTPLVAAVRREGALAAVAALEAHRRTLHSAANWHTPSYDVVADGADAARALADGILGAGPRRMELRFLDRTGFALPAFREAAAAAGYHVLSRPLLESPYVDIGGDWDEYAATLNPTVLRDVGRRRRRLERDHGPVSFGPDGLAPGLEEALEIGFALEASGWKGRAGSAIDSRPETRAFYTRVARWADEQGWLRLEFLSAGGRAIAFRFDFEVDGVVYHLKPGYDEDFGRYSPGKLLTEHAVRTAFERGARSYEFLGAAALHKLEWTPLVRERLVLQAFAPTPQGVAELTAFRYGRPAAVRAVRAARRVRSRLRR
jgi:CelD/BcsL family acetyltransferase involved in cellulose biosynthesis